MQRLTIRYRPVGDLHAYDRNPRTHDADQVEQIANSIKTFGWTNPILLDETDTVIAGHGRLEAAKLLEMEKVPTIVLKDVDDDMRRALVIADNKLALNAGWDEDMLRDEIQLLQETDFDIDVAGFSEDELAALFDDDENQSTNGNGEGNAPIRDQHNLLIECDSERQAEKLFNEFEERGLSVRIVD